jgi:2-oxoglutarate ferredoxin oxidoreductase subunit gamma
LIAVQSQSYGPEARGGSTRSDIIISDREIRYPKVTQPNVLVCLTQEAYNKFFQIIRPGGILLTDTRFVKTQKKVDAQQVELPIFENVMEKIGRPIVFNICMLGVLIGLTQLVRAESVMNVLRDRIPSGFIQLNEQALKLGMDLSPQD